MAHNGELSSCDECNTTCADLSISFMEVYIHEMLQYGLNLLLLLLLMMMTWLYSIRGGSIGLWTEKQPVASSPTYVNKTNYVTWRPMLFSLWQNI